MNPGFGSRLRMMPLVLALGLCAGSIMLGSPAAIAQSLPSAMAGLSPGLRESGAGRFRYWGFHVYDARLWVRGEKFDPDQPFVLGLRYARTFDGGAIAQSSTDEIRRLNVASDAQLARWDGEMRRLFPDVKPDDELIAVNQPGRGVLFFHNGKQVGEIVDPEFARAFFAIWLDPRTRASSLRLALLGEPAR